MLLDISIRDATDDRHSLDDVMRALYTRFYQRQKGFTTADLLALLGESGMPDVDAFYQRYINGRDPLPYESVFAKAGIAGERQTTSNPFLGVNAQPNDQGKMVVQGVVPGSAAEAAGLAPGDVLLKIGRSEERRVGKSVDLGGRRIIKKKKKEMTKMPKHDYYTDAE